MKREIDLTERNDFSSDQIRLYVYNKNQGRRRLPWFRSDDDLAVRTDGLAIFTKWNTFDLTMMMDDSWSSFNSTSTTINNGWYHDSYVPDSILNQLSSTSTVTNEFALYDDNLLNFSYSTMKHFTNLTSYSIESYDEDTFFTGKRNEIKRKLQIRNVQNPPNRYSMKTQICKYCKKEFKWRENPITTSLYCSKECSQKAHDQKKIEIHKIFHDRCKVIKNGFHTLTEINRCRYEIENGDIPCLSSFIKHKKEQRYDDDRVSWRYERLYDDDLNWISLKDRRISGLQMRINGEGRPETRYSRIAVYWKGKSKNTLYPREEWWSLTGRRPQPYDEMFEKINWRDMLRKLIN